jgi:GTP-binding GTPase N-terminal
MSGPVDKGAGGKGTGGGAEAPPRPGFKPGVPKSDRDIEREIAAGTRTLVLGPYLTRRAQEAKARSGRAGGEAPLRIPEARLDEAVGLAAAIELEVVDRHILPIASPRPATLIGKGKVEEVGGLITALEIDLVVVDAPLTPVQQRNLEMAAGRRRVRACFRWSWRIWATRNRGLCAHGPILSASAGASAFSAAPARHRSRPTGA